LDGAIYYLSDKRLDRYDDDHFASEFGSPSGLIYRMALDGSDNRLLHNESVANLVVYGDYMYFIDPYNQNISKISVSDTSEITVLVEGVFFELNVYGNNMYYTNWSNIFKIDLDSKSKQTFDVVNARDARPHVIGRWIYFSPFGQDALYRLSLDNLQNEMVFEFIYS